MGAHACFQKGQALSIVYMQLIAHLQFTIQNVSIKVVLCSMICLFQYTVVATTAGAIHARCWMQGLLLLILLQERYTYSQFVTILFVSLAALPGRKVSSHGRIA